MKTPTLLLALLLAFAPSASYCQIAWREMTAGHSAALYPSIIGIPDIVVNSKGYLYAAHESTLEKWNGYRWYDPSLPYPLSLNDHITGLVLDDWDNIYISGLFTFGSPPNRYLLRFSEGHTWLSNTPGNLLAQVQCADHSGGFYSILRGTNDLIYYCDTLHWRALPSLPSNGYTLKLMLGKDDSLYACGGYRSGGYCYVARLSNNVWTPLGSGTNALRANGSINTMVHDSSGNIYAAGEFKDSSNRPYVAKWDGVSWARLGVADSFFATYYDITALAIDKKTQDIYAVGPIDPASGKYYVAHWDGQVWSMLGQGSHALNANNPITTLAIDTMGRVYAAGSFMDTVGGPYVAIWQDGDWHRVGPLRRNDGRPDYVTRQITGDTAGRIYAIGGFVDSFSTNCVMTWNGYDPIQVSDMKDAERPYWSLQTICLDDAQNIYVAGNFTDSMGYAYVTRYDGQHWHRLGTYADTVGHMRGGGFYRLCNDHRGNIYATGFDIQHGQSSSFMERWDGSHWTAVSFPMPDFSAYQVVSDAAGNIYVAGGTPSSGYIAKWDGSNWAFIPIQPGRLSSPLSVDAQGAVYAVLELDTTRVLVRWDGSVRTDLMTTLDLALPLCTPGGRYIALGYYKLYEWDGTAWIATPYDPVNNSSIYITTAYADVHDNLYIGGYFSSSRAFACNFVGTWRDTSAIPATPPAAMPTAIHELQYAQMTISPNPADQTICIRSEVAASATITVADMTGRIVKATVPASYPIVLDTRDIRDGSYIVTLTSDGHTTSKKIVILHQ